MAEFTERGAVEPLGITAYPVHSRAVRRELVRRYEKCPDCGRDLDTGFECGECEYQAHVEFPNATDGKM
jgi:hypothetical protein